MGMFNAKTIGRVYQQTALVMWGFMLAKSDDTKKLIKQARDRGVHNLPPESDEFVSSIIAFAMSAGWPLLIVWRLLTLIKEGAEFEKRLEAAIEAMEKKRQAEKPTAN